MAILQHQHPVAAAKLHVIPQLKTHEDTNVSDCSPVTCPITHLVAVDRSVYRPAPGS